MMSQANHVHALPIDFCKTHFNITLPKTPRSSKWSLSLGFPHQNRACTCLSPHMCYMPLPSHSSSSDQQGSSSKVFWEIKKSLKTKLYTNKCWRCMVQRQWSGRSLITEFSLDEFHFGNWGKNSCKLAFIIHFFFWNVIIRVRKW